MSDDRLYSGSIRVPRVGTRARSPRGRALLASTMGLLAHRQTRTGQPGASCRNRVAFAEPRNDRSPSRIRHRSEHKVEEEGTEPEFEWAESAHEAKGRNAGDIDLALQAAELLHTEAINCFCIASGDSDFSGVANRLRKAGKKSSGSESERRRQRASAGAATRSRTSALRKATPVPRTRQAQRRRAGPKPPRRLEVRVRRFAADSSNSFAAQ